MFEGIAYSREVVVRTDAEFDAALLTALPGDDIIVEDGTYGFKRLDKSGTPTAPIRIRSRNLWGARIVDARTSGQGAAFAVWKKSYFIVQGFHIVPFYRGIYGGGDETFIWNSGAIICNKIEAAREDCIKISHVNNLFIGGNVIGRSGLGLANGEGIDLVSARYFRITLNDVDGSAYSASNVGAKGGSLAGLIDDNYVHDTSTANGITIGGSGASTRYRPDDLVSPGMLKYQASNVDVVRNIVRRVNVKNCINVWGGVRSQIVSNDVDGFIGVSSGGGVETEHILVADNDTGSPVRVDSSVGGDIVQKDNRTTGPKASLAEWQKRADAFRAMFYPTAVADCSECEARVEALTAQLAVSQRALSESQALIAQVHAMTAS